MQHREPTLFKVIGRRQVKRTAKDGADNPKKRVKFSLHDDAGQIEHQVGVPGEEVRDGEKVLGMQLTEHTLSSTMALLGQEKSSTSKTEVKCDKKRKIRNVVSKTRPNSEHAGQTIYEFTNYEKNQHQHQTPTTPYGLCKKIQEKKALSDQQGCKKHSVDSSKDKRSTNLATVDSHNFRTSSTNEVNRLRNIIEEQENEILSLQEKLDSKLETNTHKGFSEQALLAKGCANVDTFPAMYNQADLPYDQDTSRAFSSLITINHQKNTEEMALRKENMLLKNELQEAKDHMELLEFRILEFTEDQKTPQITRCDHGTSTDGWTDSQQNTKYITSLQNNRVSKEYLLGCNQRLHDIFDSSDRISSSSQLQTFLELKEQFKKYSELDVSASMDLIPVMDKISEISEFLPTSILPYDADAQSITSLHQDKKLLEDQGKLDLLNKLEVLTKENKELQELITTLSESHETQTEASGTESELVHGKTPSISSDLSDTECDAGPNLRDTKSALHNLASLQESGIFEPQCDMADAETQTAEEIVTENTFLSYNTQYISMSLASSIDNDHIDDDTEREPRKCNKQFTKVPDLNAQLSVEDASAVRVQDLQESDEYLLSDVDDRVILTKSEYDAIVSEERSLRGKIEELNAENEELILKCDATEAQLGLANSKTSSNDERESMRGAVRVLEEQLQSAEKHSKQFYEEKCEYEEAENDARLMVQRLQSQLQAAKEMEALLSASLSQEQEFSRELHKCLTDVQERDEQDKMKEEKYLREIKELLEREKLLMADTQMLKVHYFTVIFKLLVKEYFRESGNQKKLEITYDATTLNETGDVAHSKINIRSSFLSRMKLVSQIPLLLGNLVPNLRLSKYPHIPTLETPMDERIDAEVIDPLFCIEPMDCVDSYSKIQEEQNLNDRESFYLQQIEILQHEKKNLRNDFENNDGQRYQQYVSCRNELERTSNALEKSENEKCKLIFRIEELQYELQSAKDSNEQCIQDLQYDYTSMCENLRRQKQDLSSHYEGRLDQVNKARHLEEAKAEEGKRKLTFIHLELAPYIDESMRNGSQESVSDDLVYVSNLVKSEASLRDKIFELQEKERAYMETIAEADKIMSAHVTSYNKRIKELENKFKDKNPILTTLEERLQSMKEKISFNSSCLESNELEDFLSKVQLELHKLHFSLNKSSNEANFLDAPDTQVNEDDKSLDAEFYEKEELLQKLLKLTTEKSSLSSQLQEAHEATRKMSEMLQNEHYFRIRVEELESSETCLREDLKKYESCIVQKDRKYEDKTNILKEEIQSLKFEIEKAHREMHQARNSESLVKTELTEMKTQIEAMKSELQQSSDENENTTSQHRLEVARLRSQLNITNSQLIEIGGVSGDLTEKLNSSEHLIKEVMKQLEEKTKSCEADILSFNLKISQKESRIEDMEAHMQQLKHNEAANELDGLASLPFSELHNTLKEIFKGLKECSKCEKYSTAISTLMEHSEIFKQLINGRSIHSDSESDGEKSKGWETENVSPVSEKHQEENTQPKLSHIIEINPCVPPRPRRDAKLKRKWKRSPTNEESIMDELQATMKPAKKPHHGKIKAKELRQNIKTLENKVKLRDEELQLADIEVTDLYGKLDSNNEAIEMKQVEISNLQNSMVTFRKEFLTTVEKDEKARQDTEEKHKEEIEAMHNASNEMKNQLSNWKQITSERNQLLKSLIEVIRAEVCPGKLNAILFDVQKCTTNPGTDVGGYTNEQLLEYLHHMIKQAAIDQEESNNRSLSERTPKAENLNASTKGNILQCKGISFNTAVDKISKIPKLKQPYIPRLREKTIRSEIAKPKITRTSSIIKHIDPLNKRLPLANKSNRQNNVRCIGEKKNIHKENQRAVCTKSEISVQHKNKKIMASRKENSNHLENTANNRIGTERLLEADIRLGEIKPSVSIPSRCYMRSLKRAVPTTAMKHESRNPYPHTTCQRKGSLKQENQLDVPRPQNLKITRRVGIDGAVIAWAQMTDECIAGFQVIVDGRVIQQVRSPKRTKALVNGLPFNDGFTISLSTISTEGRCSIPVTVTHKRLSEARRNAQCDKSKRLKTTFTCFSP